MGTHPAITHLFAAAAIAAAALSAAATAREAVAQKAVVDVASTVVTAPAPAAPETITVEIVHGGAVLWSGRLRVGGTYGTASFNQSVSEFAGICPGQAANQANPSVAEQQASRQLTFFLNRANWQQEADRFTVNVSITRPLPPCEGVGNSMTGFNRQVTLVPGQTVRIAGEGGLEVRLTSRRD